ncbi:MAG: glycosyltransferase, partial [Planctomycetota bacterium]
MRILMLGWEFPPFIAGGLGTACHGLTRGLAQQGHDVLFVLPRAIGKADSGHVTLMGPDGVAEIVQQKRTVTIHHPGRVVRTQLPGTTTTTETTEDIEVTETRTRRIEGEPPAAGSTRMFEIDAGFSSPYGTGGNVGEQAGGRDFTEVVRSMAQRRSSSTSTTPPSWLESIAAGRTEDIQQIVESIQAMAAADNQYGSDLMGDAERYAKVVSVLATKTDFDVVHAHDWLAYPAGLAVKAITGKPLVAHMHATEFDRSGQHINQAVYDIERAGMHGADRVIAVSQLTKNVVVHRYGVDEPKVDVVYNGVELNEDLLPEEGIGKDDKIVLFLGRITMQKGPEYFIRAAKRVLQKVENVKFVVAGSGDMAARMIEEAAALGIGHKVLFTGFLRGKDVKRVFKLADCYVMPSVSEPFGIAPLEAMQQDTPVIISKQSGVSEVLSHALK